MTRPARLPTHWPDQSTEQSPQAPLRWKLPLCLFLATCLSTWFVGSIFFDQGTAPFAENAEADDSWGAWFPRAPQEGLIYMASLMVVLSAHEMGHFLQGVRYKTRSSFPYFIPLPIPPIGTMGAVIVSTRRWRNRRELFDVGITGPIAGLVFAIPLAVSGILNADAVRYLPILGGQTFNDPLLFRILTAHLRPDIPEGFELVLQPILWASWVGLFLTGLNMFPCSQLDGGHVAYAIFGKHARYLSYLVLGSSVGFAFISGQYGMLLIPFLIYRVIGVHHPPTLNDDIPLGLGRTILGLACLTLPIFCFVPEIIN